MNDDPVNPTNNEQLGTETSSERQVSSQSQSYTSRPNYQEVSSQSAKGVNLTPLGTWLSLLMLGTLGLLGYGYYKLDQKITSLESNLGSVQSTITAAPTATIDAISALDLKLSGLEDNISNLSNTEALTQTTTVSSGTSSPIVTTTSINQLNQRVSKIESNLRGVQDSLADTPQATVQALIAWQDAMQAQQAEQQARAQQRQQGLTVDEEIADIKAGQALSTSINNEHATVGVPEATVVLMEFSDLNCGFCARYHSETMPRIIENYVDTGKIRYVYRDYVGVGGQVSQDAASHARCLREDVDDATYLSFIREIYAIQGRKDSNNVSELAKNFGAGESFEACAEEERYAEAVQRDTTTGQRLGIRGTPGFIIGFAQEDGTVDGINVQGALPYEVFERYLDGFLAEAETASTESTEVANN